jgi:hypothetical protein
LNFNLTAQGCHARRLSFERHADKVAVAPDQPAVTHRTEMVERDAKFGRHDVEAIQSKASTMVGHITNATWVDSILTHEEHQYIAIDRRAAHGASLDVASRLPANKMINRPSRRQSSALLNWD